MYSIVVTDRAHGDIARNADWWERHRSKRQADEWVVGIYAAIESLAVMPARCAAAPEATELGRPVRNLLYGISRRATHRVLFGIDDETVVIYRVLHMSQSILSDDGGL